MLLHKRKRASKIGNTHTQRNDSRGGVWVKGGGPHPICGCVGVKLSPFLYHFWARKMWNKVINGDVASSFAFLLILTPWKPPNRTTSSIRILVVAGNKLNAENNTKTSSLLAALTILVTRAQFTLSVETYGKWQWMMSMELGWDVGVNVGGGRPFVFNVMTTRRTIFKNNSKVGVLAFGRDFTSGISLCAEVWWWWGTYNGWCCPPPFPTLDTAPTSVSLLIFGSLLFRAFLIKNTFHFPKPSYNGKRTGPKKIKKNLLKGRLGEYLWLSFNFSNLLTQGVSFRLAF